MVEVCGVVGLDVRRRGGGLLLQPVQDLGVEGWGHLVDHFALPLLPVLASPLDDVLHGRLQRDGLRLQAHRAANTQHMTTESHNHMRYCHQEHTLFQERKPHRKAITDATHRT